MTYSKYSQKSNQPKAVTQKLEGQIKNSQGFYVHKLDDWDTLNRFLILGTTAPTYHAGTANVGKNVSLVEKLVKKDGARVVQTVLDLTERRALINKNQAIFVLAYALKFGDLKCRRMVVDNVDQVIRTGRDEAQFVEEILGLGGGWGKLTKTAVGKFYTRNLDNLAYQVVKYRNTGQFEHRNILRLSHVKPETEGHNDLFMYLVGKDVTLEKLPEQVRIFEYIKTASKADVIRLIKAGTMTHEMVPSKYMNDVDVWEALLPHMAYRALVWNLGKMSSLGMTKKFSQTTDLIIKKLRDNKAIIGSRIHPFTMLTAIRNYNAGKGMRLSWEPNAKIVQALEYAMDVLYMEIERSDKKVIIVVDTSGSMGGYYLHRGNIGMVGSRILPIEVGGAMAAIQSRQYDAYVIGVDTSVHPDVGVTDTTRISDAITKLAKFGGGGTNLGLAMDYLTKNKINADAIVYYTDNEVNRGQHVSQLFKQYQREVNRNAKFVTVGVEANNFTIADPNANDMLDVQGFDAGALKAIQEFIDGTF